MARIAVIASAFVLLGALSAFAQDAQTPPPGPPPGGPGMDRPMGGPGMGVDRPMGGHGGWMAMHHHMMMDMDKAASFRFRRDGAEISIRCASTEPTKACVDAASVLIDKIAAVAPK
jgi:hypothetical protein